MFMIVPITISFSLYKSKNNIVYTITTKTKKTCDILSLFDVYTLHSEVNYVGLSFPIAYLSLFLSSLLIVIRRDLCSLPVFLNFADDSSIAHVLLTHSLRFSVG